MALAAAQMAIASPTVDVTSLGEVVELCDGADDLRDVAKLRDTTCRGTSSMVPMLRATGPIALAAVATG